MKCRIQRIDGVDKGKLNIKGSIEYANDTQRPDGKLKWNLKGAEQEY